MAARVDGTYDCAICGPVDGFPVGRGVMCSKRAEELGWRKPTMQPTCHRCGDELRSGYCLNCTPLTVPASYEGLLGSPGVSVLWRETRLRDDVENAVPGWQTRGSDEPCDSERKVNPAYAALYGVKSG